MLLLQDDNPSLLTVNIWQVNILKISVLSRVHMHTIMEVQMLSSLMEIADGIWLKVNIWWPNLDWNEGTQFADVKYAITF